MTDQNRTVRGWQDRNEAAAANLVCSYLGGTARKVDPGGGPRQLHDFDIDLPDGTTMALEVTQHIDAAEIRTLSEIQKRDWASDRLTLTWSVGTVGTLNVANLHRDLPSLLEALEESQSWSWIAAQRSPPPDEPVLARLHRLGVRAAQARQPAEGTGPIILTRSSVGHWFDATDVLDAIEAEANDPGNARKLTTAANVDLRALFIWAGDFAGAVEAAMTWGELPESPPAVPEGVDEVWIATASQPAKVWRHSGPAGWEKLDDFLAAD